MLETVFCCDDLPPAERFAWYHDVMLNRNAPAQVDSDQITDFSAELRELDLGAVKIAFFRISPCVARRTPVLVRRSDPELYKLALVRGGHGMSIRGRDSRLDAGDLVLFDTSHPFEEWTFAGGEEQGQIVVSVPRAVLPVPSGKVDQLLAHRIPGDSGWGRLVAGFLHGVAADASDLRSSDAPRMGTVVLDLVTAPMAHHLDAETLIPPESRQEALLCRIHAFIDAHLGDAGLSPQAISDAHHISVRYLHRLFQQQGTTVGSWIRTRRLEGCRRDLAEPLLASRPIHATAARWGFTRPADFSRMFRTAYGVSPRDYRENAIRTQ